MTAASLSLKAALSQVGADVDRRLDTFLTIPNDPRADLYRAMRHAAIGGGKRLRPLLVFATARLFAVDRDCAGRVATAIECIHVYSLIHDDLPAMDDDDMRRGKPTVHKAFDEATAILAGDCLHALAFEILADPATHPDPFVRSELVLDLARSAGPSGMAGGQAMDSGGREVDVRPADRHAPPGDEDRCANRLFGRSGCDPRQGAARGARGPARLCARHGARLPDRRRHSRRRGGRSCGRQEARQGRRRGEGNLPLAARARPRARAQARMLVDQAIQHLQHFGPEADLLRDIARFTLERDR